MTESERPVLIAGPLFLDLVMGPLDALPRGGQESWVENCTLSPGGAANQAIALTRLGINANLRAYLGTDAPGRLLADLLASSGIGSDTLEPVERQSITAALSIGTERALVSYGTNRIPSLTGLPKPRALVADLRAISENRAVVSEWRTGADPTVVIGDVGWDESGRWDPKDLTCLDLVDWFVPNEEEALRYTRCTSVEKAARRLHQACPSVVITRGSAGVWAVDSRGEIGLPSVPVPAVDSTGAGDTFAAMLTWATLRHLPLVQALSCASVAAAYSVRSLGGASSAPSLRQLSTWVSHAAIPACYDLRALRQEVSE